LRHAEAFVASCSFVKSPRSMQSILPWMAPGGSF
jgi:hypothetical protein